MTKKKIYTKIKQVKINKLLKANMNNIRRVKIKYNQSSSNNLWNRKEI